MLHIFPIVSPDQLLFHGHKNALYRHLNNTSIQSRYLCRLHICLQRSRKFVMVHFPPQKVIHKTIVPQDNNILELTFLSANFLSYFRKKTLQTYHCKWNFCTSHYWSSTFRRTWCTSEYGKATVMNSDIPWQAELSLTPYRSNNPSLSFCEFFSENNRRLWRPI